MLSLAEGLEDGVLLGVTEGLELGWHTAWDHGRRRLATWDLGGLLVLQILHSCYFDNWQQGQGGHYVHGSSCSFQRQWEQQH